ncbi:Aste57867_16640 [Aphanomyces stellatus]|uniref:Aste57867_16640 protein n=1 Tax=Aphanomyces stellatus TaxID=120398 RepID=A0A485L645_9STRA|nr:hypothetical protein As57867_016583 [Aphanomyces stellatus]VFT93411.1 Aste57867_16640 [Aphanomyces stellatus]
MPPPRRGRVAAAKATTIHVPTSRRGASKDAPKDGQMKRPRELGNSRLKKGSCKKGQPRANVPTKDTTHQAQRHQTRKKRLNEELAQEANAFFLKLLMETPLDTVPRKHGLSAPPNKRPPKKTRSRETISLGEERRILTYDDDDSVELSRNFPPKACDDVISCPAQHERQHVKLPNHADEVDMDISGDSIDISIDNLQESHEFTQATTAPLHNFDDPFFESITFASTSPPPNIRHRESSPSYSMSSFSSPEGPPLSPLAIPSTPPPPLRRLSFDQPIVSQRKSAQPKSHRKAPRTSKSGQKRPEEKSTRNPSSRKQRAKSTTKAPSITTRRTASPKQPLPKQSLPKSARRSKPIKKQPPPDDTRPRQPVKKWHPLDVRAPLAARLAYKNPFRDGIPGGGVRVNQNPLCSLQQLFMI